MVTEYAAFGTKIGQSAAGASGTATFFAKVKDVSGPSISSEFDETTNHMSTGSYNTFVPTTKLVGDLSFELVFDPHSTTGNVTGIYSWWSAQTIQNFHVVFPDNSTWNFEGYVASISPKAPVKGQLAADIVIKPSGPMELL